jgi:hypothetical protein
MIKTNFKKSCIGVAAFFAATAVLVYAAPGEGDGPDQIAQNVIAEIFVPIYQLVAAIAVVYFLYGGLRFFYEKDQPLENNTGKRHLLWGMVGLFIIFSVGGILGLFGGIFGQLGAN